MVSGRDLVMEPVYVEAPASTANLGPGFDALALALDMHLRVTVTPLEFGGEQLLVEGEGADEIGPDAGNRFLIGIERGLQHFGAEPPVMRIEMDNEIPLARGLGSSAAASVAGLKAAEALAGEALGPDLLLRLATEIEGHPDNAAAALFGGFVIAGRSADGTPRAAHFEAPIGLEAALFIPQQRLRTADMRAALPDSVAHSDAAHNVGRASMVVAALAGNRLELLSAMADDRLHEPYRVAHFPQLPDLVAAAMSAGALGAALSGAGSTVIALCDGADAAEAAAATMAAVAERSGLEGRSLVLRPTASGASVMSGAKPG